MGEHDIWFDLIPGVKDAKHALAHAMGKTWLNVEEIHELNHVVDSYTIANSNTLASRKAQLIAAAGTNRFNYLRGGNGLEFLTHGFFAQNPQEFFASIANQWFADSEQVFELEGAQRLRVEAA